MRTWLVLIVMILCLAFWTGCTTTKVCGGCGGKCGECACSEAKAGEVAACSGCAALIEAKATAWCEACGKGYYEGKEVKCKGGCKANPGGLPCKNCVK